MSWAGKTLTDDELRDILERHSLWLRGEQGGSRAELHDVHLLGVNLYGVNLSRAELYGTDLSRADLSGADLSRADLSGADLSRANLSGANLSGANLSGANLSGANLSDADLSHANLSGANLSGADIYDADLYDADLSHANLSGAAFCGATGINKYLCTPLLILLDQPGKIRAYKLVTADGVGPFNGGITYRVGEDYEVADANTDDSIACAEGINLATLDWCMREWRQGYRILVAEFEAKDVAAIPTATDGKFRVRRCSIVAEKNLADIGLLAEDTA